MWLLNRNEFFRPTSLAGRKDEETTPPRKNMCGVPAAVFLAKKMEKKLARSEVLLKAMQRYEKVER